VQQTAHAHADRVMIALGRHRWSDRDFANAITDALAPVGVTDFASPANSQQIWRTIPASMR
jgi:hypothetical protein